MLDDSTADTLTHAGFREIGALSYEMAVSIWWNEEHRLQVLVLPFGGSVLMKGSKPYVMKAITADGETYVRDIPQLHDYLERHFAELRIAFSHFRDVGAQAAWHHLKARARRSAPVRQAGATRGEGKGNADAIRAGLEVMGEFLRQTAEDSGLLARYIENAQTHGQRSLDVIERRQERQREETRTASELHRRYLNRGSAASFSFTVSSNVQSVASAAAFRDALESIVKELRDLHRFQVTQKLNGGRLNISVEESQSPEMDWIEQWFGGGLAPRTVDQLDGNPCRYLQGNAAARAMVTADEDIRVDGAVQEPRKLLGARIASSLFQRLDGPGHRSESRTLTEAEMPISLGRLESGSQLGEAYVFPLSESRHVYISGTTGSGKSYAGRVLVEEAAQYDDLGILVLDPRNQWAGLLTPEDRQKILDCYEDFGLDREKARGFEFKYACPGHGLGAKPNGTALASGRNIVSFKGLDDRERCSLFADLLDGSFEAIAHSESESPRLLIVVEEAHRFTRKRVDAAAKQDAARAEITLDRVVREGRKFGCCVAVLSQTIRDFAYDAASIRQNTNTKVFMQNSDREVEYANDFIDNGKEIIQLPPATAVVHNPAWGTQRIRVRPPLSKVWEFNPEETARLISPGSPPSILTSEARALLAVVESACESFGAPRIGQLGGLAGIASKRRLHALVAELEQHGLVRTCYLSERGKPRVVEFVQDVDERAEETNSTADGSETRP